MEIFGVIYSANQFAPVQAETATMMIMITDEELQTASTSPKVKLLILFWPAV